MQQTTKHLDGYNMVIIAAESRQQRASEARERGAALASLRANPLKYKLESSF
jgi:hypothetical protein